MKRSIKSMGIVAAIVAATVSTGCAIRIAEPAKTVAYDYTDHEFYNRPHAASPRYEEADAPPRPASLAAGLVSAFR